MSNFIIATPNVCKSINWAFQNSQDKSIAESNLDFNTSNLTVTQKRIKDESSGEGITFKGQFTPVISGEELFVTNFDGENISPDAGYFYYDDYAAPWPVSTAIMPLSATDLDVGDYYFIYKYAMGFIDYEWQPGGQGLAPLACDWIMRTTNNIQLDIPANFRGYYEYVFTITYDDNFKKVLLPGRMPGPMRIKGRLT